MSGDWRAALKAAVFAFLLSRAVIVLAAAIALALAQQTWPGTPGAPDATIRLFAPDALSALHDRILANDAGWYAGIVRDGYEARPFDAGRQANWAFFPLHPLAWKAAASLGPDLAISGVLLANLLLFFGLFQAHRWAQLLYDTPTANRLVLCIALFPTAYFFSLPWTESLFLALTASSLLAMAQRRWGRATFCNLLASATRPTGILLSALLWWEGRDGRRLPRPRFWLLAILGTAGLLAFMALLHARTGNAFAFSDIQSAWGRDGGSLTKHLRRWLADPLLLAEDWNVRWINNSALLFGLAGTAWLWRSKRRGLALFAFFGIALPWATGTLVSMGRYVATCIPLFLALAHWTRSTNALVGWLVVSACALAGMSACFALGASFAGA